jgi:hypothetical protein
LQAQEAAVKLGSDVGSIVAQKYLMKKSVVVGSGQAKGKEAAAE